MKVLKITLMIVILSLISSFSYSSELGSLRVSLLKGDAEIRNDQMDESFFASINMPLREGDILSVSERGRVEIQMDDGSILRLDGDSTLKIVMISKGTMWFDLRDGRAYVNFKGNGYRTIKIGVPYLMTLNTDEPSIFNIDFHRRRYAEASVFKGMVYVDVSGYDKRIYAGDRLTVEDDMYVDISSLGPSDEWERWNREMDNRFEGSWYGLRYLPDELRVYTYEFDSNGKWVYTTQYGYVWVPTVYITKGWTPYRHGRWIWRGDHYVWISYEPWGWVPYHYGRWAFSVSIGWFWVPPVRGAVYWGPGFVGWIYTPSYVAWVPLAPEDIYYGYGYYGPSSVNVVNIDIHNTVIKNVYKNVYVNNAVTVVSRDSFIKGKYVSIKTDRNPFITEGVKAGTVLASERFSLVPARSVTVNKKQSKIVDNDRRYEEWRIITRGDRRVHHEDRKKSVTIQREIPREYHKTREIEGRPNDRMVESRKRELREDSHVRDVRQIPENIHQHQQMRRPDIKHTESNDRREMDKEERRHITENSHRRDVLQIPENVHQNQQTRRPDVKRYKDNRETDKEDRRHITMGMNQWMRR